MARRSRSPAEESWEAGAPVPAQIRPYVSGQIGGLLAGLAMAAVTIVLSVIEGMGPWFPLNLVASTILRFYQTAPPEVLTEFSYPALVVGLVLHLALSVAIGTLFVLLLPTLPGRPLVWGIILGPLLWFVTQFIVLPLVNPLISQVNLVASFIAHLVFGIVLGWWVERTPTVPAEAEGQPTLPYD